MITTLLQIKPPMTVSGELKFADTKSKCFKNYTFEFSQAKLCCYKDKGCAVKLHEWKIEDMIWYLGHEPKRNPQMGYVTMNHLQLSALPLNMMAHNII